MIMNRKRNTDIGTSGSEQEFQKVWYTRSPSVSNKKPHSWLYAPAIPVKRRTATVKPL